MHGCGLVWFGFFLSLHPTPHTPHPVFGHYSQIPYTHNLLALDLSTEIEKYTSLFPAPKFMIALCVL